MSDNNCTDPKKNCEGCDVENCSLRRNTPPEIRKKQPGLSSHIRKIVGVLSGKGGVGKSFVTTTLAVELARKGFRVGIMDADITGPSVPRLLNVHDRAYGSDKEIYPCVTEKYGIKVISVNLMLESEDTPVLWRGPIVSGIVDQFFTDTLWGELDYLLIDMPPGTSDVALTVLQDIPLDGLLMVSTPSRLVSMVVSKAIVMAGKADVPVLGLVDNMAYVRCEECGHEIHLYKEDDCERIAETYGLPILARLPLDAELSSLSDEGKIEEYEGCFHEKTIELLESLKKEG